MTCTSHYARHWSVSNRADKLGACNDNEPVAQEDSADEGFVWFRVDPDDQIIAFLDHVHGSVVSGDFQSHIWMFQRETCGDLSHGGLGQ